MLITYFDEVKYQAGRQEFYWLAGISVRPEHIRQLEHEVNALAAECFGSGILSKQTELHASEIFGRGGNFKAWRDTPKRMDVLKRFESHRDYWRLHSVRDWSHAFIETATAVQS